MSDQESSDEVSDVEPSTRWLLVGFVVAMCLAIGAVALLYQPKPADTICSNAEARCGDKSDGGVQ